LEYNKISETSLGRKQLIFEIESRSKQIGLYSFGTGNKPSEPEASYKRVQARRFVLFASSKWVQTKLFRSIFNIK